MKTLIIFLLSFLLCACSSENAELTNPTIGIPQIGNSGYYAITGESQEKTLTSEGKTLHVKAFSHKIHDPKGEHLVTLTTALTRKGQTILSADAELSELQSDDLSLSTHLTEDTVTVVLYSAQISMCHFQYRLGSDGNWKYLS